MSRQIKVLALFLFAAFVIFLGVISAQKQTSGSDVPLKAIFRVPPSGIEKISNDQPGLLYENGVATKGYLKAILTNPRKRGNGYLYIEIDSADDYNVGRFVNLMFDTYHYDSDGTLRECYEVLYPVWEPQLPADFEIGVQADPSNPRDPVKTRWFMIKTGTEWRWNATFGKFMNVYEQYAMDFTKMAPGQIAYVGMDIRFRVTTESGEVSDIYCVGNICYPVQVIAGAGGAGGPKSWVIRSVDDTSIFLRDPNNPALATEVFRYLLRLHDLGPGDGLDFWCHGIFELPFELTIYR